MPLLFFVNNGTMDPIEFVEGNDLKGLYNCITSDSNKIEARDEFGMTPLHVACSLGYLKIASMLLDQGASLKAKDHGGITPVIIAYLNEHHHIVDFIRSYERVKAG
jgi:ankyrin repeat protein